MPVRVLCCGDIHLGLRPSKIPETLRSKFELSLRTAFKALCQYAIEKKVTAIVFSGDIADARNSYFEAYAVMKEEIGRLEQAGIPAVAVAGNHDFDVLAKLADELPGFTLLGRDGSWELHELKLKETEFGCDSLSFLGRSFTARHEPHSPLHDLPSIDPNVPTIGVLHCDVNVPESNYAPVDLTGLQRNCPTAWVLGHIHKPTVFDNPKPIFYPGTLQGLDPSESGPRGPWILNIESAQLASISQVHLAPFRYESINVDISNVDDIADIQHAILREFEQWQRSHQSELEYCRAIAVRLKLTGSTSLLNKEEAIGASLEGTSEFSSGSTVFFLEKVEYDLCSPLSLDELSRSSDLPGILAKKLLIIRDQQPEADYSHLIAESIDALASDTGFRQLRETYGNRPNQEHVRAQLLKSGMKLLGELLSQGKAG